MQAQSFGTWRGVSLEIAAWDAARVEVDLSVACMFAQETANAGLNGGLLHLDQALSGSLTALRRSGEFKAGFMEAILVSKPPITVKAKAVLMIGLGKLSSWTAEASAYAIATAVRAAVYRSDQSMAFAPSLLDSGLSPDQTDGVAFNMVRAVIETIEMQVRIVERGLAGPLLLRRAVFDVGASRMDMTTEFFRENFEKVVSSMPEISANDPVSAKGGGMKDAAPGERTDH